MKIAVVGTGYVGMSIAMLLSQHHDVVAVDIAPERVESINRRISPIADAEIDLFFAQRNLRLTATLESKEAYRNAGFVVVATPTNYDPRTNFFDTSIVESVIREVNEENPDATLVIKSTVPVGFTERLHGEYRNLRIIFSPEFLREGKALWDNLHPSRIIVGVPSEDERLRRDAEAFAGMLAQGAAKQDIPTLIMRSSEAEAVKLFSNAYLALRVSFFNELDSYAELLGLSAKAMIDGIGFDPRIGSHYNNPSFGYGGYCLPKDTKQLLASFSQVPNKIISAIVDANQMRIDFIAKQAMRLAERTGKHDPMIGVYRLAMKAGSDNYRDSSTIRVMEKMREERRSLVLFEPSVKGSLFMGCRVIPSLDAFKRISDVVIANRYDSVLDDVREKVYTRDLYCRD